MAAGARRAVHGACQPSGAAVADGDRRFRLTGSPTGGCRIQRLRAGANPSPKSPHLNRCTGTSPMLFTSTSSVSAGTPLAFDARVIAERYRAARDAYVLRGLVALQKRA